MTEEPFLLISNTGPVRCAKCGRDMPTPGRIAIKTIGDARYYCDCVTEDEMQGIVAEWNQYMALAQMPDANPQ
ncbi:MAG TPA: hypothetical protein VMW79_07800 [Anaerolineae bacterium]|nr:hypothetical protein [Anaerolineae bacterium]